MLSVRAHPGPCPALADDRAQDRPSDREWLLPVTIVISIEALLWCAAYFAGTARRPMIATYGTIALGIFTLAVCLSAALLLIRERPPSPARRLLKALTDNRERLLIAILGSQLLAFGSAAFGSLKAGIPRLVPFWIDLPVSRLEVGLFGTHAWAATHSVFGWAIPLFDRLYATFVGTHIFAVLLLLAATPSRLKSRALLALALAWLFLGVFGAYLLSSAGPIFYDRVHGGGTFQALTDAISAKAPITTFTANALWDMHQSGQVGFANGISAMPSMHVTLTLWLALVLKRSWLAPLGWTYFGLIWLGSVLLGWHWFFDGLVATLGMLALWQIAPRLLYCPAADAKVRAGLMAVKRSDQPGNSPVASTHLSTSS